ncbi:MAG: hypothetical protein HY051_03430 [Candidatus Aenigmarchaeota archaeon]|nr:hypothetical protein [Candidatus Aenigmarchaeota archaeon]
MKFLHTGFLIGLAISILFASVYAVADANPDAGLSYKSINGVDVKDVYLDYNLGYADTEDVKLDLGVDLTNPDSPKFIRGIEADPAGPGLTIGSVESPAKGDGLTINPITYDYKGAKKERTINAETSAKITTPFFSTTYCTGQWSKCSWASEDDGYPANATVSTGVNKTSVWYKFGFGVNFTPEGYTVKAVYLKLDFFVKNDTSGLLDPSFKNLDNIMDGYIDVRVSGNGGITYGLSHVINGRINEATYIVNVTDDLAWTLYGLGDSQFKVNVTCFRKGFGNPVDCRLDYLGMSAVIDGGIGDIEFNLISHSVTPNSSSIVQGEIAEANVSVFSMVSPIQVNLSAEGCPPASSCIFQPQNGTTPFSSTFRVVTIVNTPNGTYRINTTATAASSRKSIAVYTLTVLPRPRPLVCASKIDLSFNNSPETDLGKTSNVYTVGEPYNLTVKIYNTSNMTMPDKLFFVNVTQNDTNLGITSLTTGSDGVYYEEGTIPNDAVGKWLFDAFVNDTGCPYISDTEKLIVLGQGAVISNWNISTDKDVYNTSETAKITVSVEHDGGGIIQNPFIDVIDPVNQVWTVPIKSGATGCSVAGGTQPASAGSNGIFRITGSTSPEAGEPSPTPGGGGGGGGPPIAHCTTTFNAEFDNTRLTGSYTIRVSSHQLGSKEKHFEVFSHLLAEKLIQHDIEEIKYITSATGSERIDDTDVNFSAALYNSHSKQYVAAIYEFGSRDNATKILDEALESGLYEVRPIGVIVKGASGVVYMAKNKGSEDPVFYVWANGNQLALIVSKFGISELSSPNSKLLPIPKIFSTTPSVLTPPVSSGGGGGGGGGGGLIELPPLDDWGLVSAYVKKYPSDLYAITSFTPPKSCSGEWNNCSFVFENDSKSSTAIPQLNKNKTGRWSGYNFTSLQYGRIKSVILRADFSASNNTLDSLTAVDVNQDGVVDIFDAEIVGENFGKTANDANNPRADVNRDGVVDDQDISLVSDSFRKSVPSPLLDMNGYLDIRISGDGGKTYGPSHIIRGTLGEKTYLINVTDDFEWTPEKLNSTNFVINATCFKNSFSEVECRLDWMPVQVSFVPAFAFIIDPIIHVTEPPVPAPSGGGGGGPPFGSSSSGRGGGGAITTTTATTTTAATTTTVAAVSVSTPSNVKTETIPTATTVTAAVNNVQQSRKSAIEVFVESIISLIARFLGR